MALTVLSVAYPLARVGPGAVGGAEQVLGTLDRALVAAGHRSLMVACEGSRVAGTLLPVPAPPDRIDEAATAARHADVRRAIHEALACHPVDLVHLHGIDFAAYPPPPGVPVLVTLHLPPGWYPRDIFAPARPDTHLVCVSASQQRACPPGAPLVPYIGNGVDIDHLSARLTKWCFALTLGRVCPEKGFHLVLEAARRAGLPLLIAGRVFPYEAPERYFAAEIRPRLGATRRFLGPIGGARKRRLLAAARCLLVPSLAPETSSLVAMEAMASGTPVVAFRSGAAGVDRFPCLGPCILGPEPLLLNKRVQHPSALREPDTLPVCRRRRGLELVTHAARVLDGVPSPVDQFTVAGEAFAFLIVHGFSPWTDVSR